ncbi:nuclear transport factor 2 family protein [Aspergillus affinis]|uniref:nuclear transport factor 2 family protein n=1 Tax=Aspergillus affinis TaxID=1070780 RepID=UPI0022FE12A8|nr:uncharacterized protein KD926_001224 [Aspergillus affinis]KAI9036909.1 hypothetical protein KD926_001224 [Aspergillus affinis]
MPGSVSCVSAPTWHTSGPETPAQQFFKNYVDRVDSYSFKHGSGLQFYSKDVVFHNQNNAQYNGGDEMWAWMKRLFRQFRSLQHDFHRLWEVKNGDGTATIMSQWTRNIWLPGNNTEEPTVSIPLSWISIIGSADFADALDGLNFREVWLYLDATLLAKYLPRRLLFSKRRTYYVRHKQRLVGICGDRASPPVG